MGLFNRKTSKVSDKPGRIPSPQEIDRAGRELAAGKDKFANRLCDEAGRDSQQVAMAILAASVDYTPQD